MVQSEGKKIDHLTEDPPIVGQRFVCLSFVSPEGIRNCTTRALKIRGSYATYQEAQERCEELQKQDPDFDIFIGEVGKWLPWDPDPNSAKDQKYQEEELQKLVDGYKNNLDKAQRIQEERKRQMIDNAAREEQTRLQKTQARLRKKLAQRQAEDAQKQMQNAAMDQLKNMIPDDVGSGKKKGGKKKKQVPLESREADIELKDEAAKGEKDRLQSNQKVIEGQKQKVATLDDQLSRIQSLYAKLKEKQEATE